MKNILLFSLLVIVLGCGSSNENSIKDMQNIIIVKNIPKGVCESSEYKLALEAIGFTNYKVQERDGDITCEDYEKSVEDHNCAVIPYYSPLQDVTNCVIGYTPGVEDISKIPNGK